MAGGHFLEHYIKYFRTAEINNSFYRLPSKETFKQWREAVPEGFIFSVKASRYITHMKKLKDAGQPLADFMERAELLVDKLGPLLFQLPPHWHCNLQRLETFLDILPQNRMFAFEFRDESWFGLQTERLLAEKGAAFCIYDFNQQQSPLSLTADFTYVRLHGPGGAYAGSYDNAALDRWAEMFLSWSGRGIEVFCYFDNDERGYAVQNALKLKQLLGQG